MQGLFIKALVLISGLILGVGALKTQVGQEKKDELVSQVGRKKEEVLNQVLNQTTNLSQKFLSQKKEKEEKVKGERQENQGGTQEETQVQPIQEPVENVQIQTEKLIQMIKSLPEEQVLAIKKQLYQEFCKELLKDIEKKEKSNK